MAQGFHLHCKSNFMKGFSDAFLADLGRVVAAWAHVEQQFHILLLSVVVFHGQSGSIDSPRVARIMGNSLNKQVRAFKDRLDELELSDQTRKNTTATLDRLIALRRARDEVAHASWNVSIRVSDDGRMELRPNEALRLFKSWKKPATPFDA
jgi:hypothetical protein